MLILIGRFSQNSYAVLLYGRKRRVKQIGKKNAKDMFFKMDRN